MNWNDTPDSLCFNSNIVGTVLLYMYHMYFQRSIYFHLGDRHQAFNTHTYIYIVAIAHRRACIMLSFFTCWSILIMIHSTTAVPSHDQSMAGVEQESGDDMLTCGGIWCVYHNWLHVIVTRSLQGRFTSSYLQIAQIGNSWHNKGYNELKFRT